MGSFERHIDARASPPWLRAAALAERQWGVVSLNQLRELGLTRDAVRRALECGRLAPLHRGVYAFGHCALRAEGRYLAAVLAFGPGALLSHLCAAAHMGLLQPSSGAIDVTVPRGRHGGPGIRIHRPRCLGPADATVHRGVPVTSVARTLLDISTHRLFGRALRQAEVLRVYDQRAFEDVLDRAGGHRGRGVFARAIATAPPATNNQLERRFLALVKRAGLPPPIVNQPLDIVDHPGIKPDFCWPAQRVIVETDGRATHLTRAAFQNDRRRDAALAAAGYVVLRFTWEDVRDEPDTVAARLAAVLRSRGVV